MLQFKGCSDFRLRIVLSTLCAQPIRIADIRAQQAPPGLRQFEIDFLNLVESISSGCSISINEQGTVLTYKPGMIMGGAGLEHQCHVSRSIGYFIEPLILLGLFGKKPLSIRLLGVTSDLNDVSADNWRVAGSALLSKLGIQGVDIKVVKRGAAPGGGGEVKLVVPIQKVGAHVNLVEEGMVKRVRGLAYSLKVSSSHSNRMVTAARGIFNKLLADVYIFTYAAKGAESGQSPGYGVLVAGETTTGGVYTAEVCAQPSRSDDAYDDEEESYAPAKQTERVAPALPEELGQQAAEMLLEEINNGGVVGSAFQSFLIVLAALGPKEVQQIRLGALTGNAVSALRHVKDFFGVVFDIRPEAASKTLFLTCVGAGMVNVARKSA